MTQIVYKGTSKCVDENNLLFRSNDDIKPEKTTLKYKIKRKLESYKKTKHTGWMKSYVLLIKLSHP